MPVLATDDGVKLYYQARRPWLYSLVDQMARISVPALIIAGDEDDGTLEGLGGKP